MKLKILTPQYFEAYKERQLYTLQKHFGKLKKKDLNAENFDFYLWIIFLKKIGCRQT